MIFNINKIMYVPKGNENIDCLRQQLLSVLNRLFLIVNIKGIFSKREVNYLKRFQRFLIEDLLYLCFQKKREGFAKFKSKCNFLIHKILLGYSDPNIIRDFRLSK